MASARVEIELLNLDLVRRVIFAANDLRAAAEEATEADPALAFAVSSYDDTISELREAAVGTEDDA